MQLFTLTLAALLLSVSLSPAQECVSPCSVDAGKSILLVWRHDPAATVTLPDGSVVTPVTLGYKVYLDGKLILTFPLSTLTDTDSDGVADTGTSTPFSAPVLVGVHTLQVSAYNASVEARSNPLSFSVKAVSPFPPTGLKIVIVATVGPTGEVTFTVQSAEIIKK